jgi:hypothetical protein
MIKYRLNFAIAVSRPFAVDGPVRRDGLYPFSW